MITWKDVLCQWQRMVLGISINIYVSREEQVDRKLQTVKCRCGSFCALADEVSWRKHRSSAQESWLSGRWLPPGWGQGQTVGGAGSVSWAHQVSLCSVFYLTYAYSFPSLNAGVDCHCCLRKQSYVAQTGFKLSGSRDPPAWGPSVGTIDCL